MTEADYIAGAGGGDTRLGELINREIVHNGPMPLSTYMSLALSHPEFGYYKSRDPLGLAGDFTTAPEISQLFGEMIGVWLAVNLEAMGAPKSVEIAELGPGRGTMLADAMRVLRQNDRADEMKLTLIETNPVLIGEQKRRLGDGLANWATELSAIEEDGPPLFILANEFFDAMPVRHFQRKGLDWHERVIGIEDGRRVWGLAPDPTPLVLPPGLADAEENEIYETAPGARDLMGQAAALVERRGGAILVIDYGYARSQAGNTLQALKRHNYVDPLAEPGLADLTTHVDFEVLALAAQEGGLEPMDLLDQRSFLQAMGIASRLAGLSAANPGKGISLTSQAKRLTDPDQMGTLFKVFCAAPGGFVPYPFAVQQKDAQ